MLEVIRDFMHLVALVVQMVFLIAGVWRVTRAQDGTIDQAVGYIWFILGAMPLRG